MKKILVFILLIVLIGGGNYLYYKYSQKDVASTGTPVSFNATTTQSSFTFPITGSKLNPGQVYSITWDRRLPLVNLSHRIFAIDVNNPDNKIRIGTINPVHNIRGQFNWKVPNTIISGYYKITIEGLPQVQSDVFVIGTIAPGTGYIFTRDLKGRGSTQDIIELKKFFISQGYLSSNTNLSGVWDNDLSMAVWNFQRKYGLGGGITDSGYVVGRTRDIINEIQRYSVNTSINTNTQVSTTSTSIVNVNTTNTTTNSQTSNTLIPTPNTNTTTTNTNTNTNTNTQISTTSTSGNINTTSTVTASTTGYRFTRDLKSGMNGQDIVELKKFLIAQGHLSPNANLSDVWDRELGNAVWYFQRKYKLGNSITESGYFVGKTRAKANEIQGF